jgi:hypothetical protein
LPLALAGDSLAHPAIGERVGSLIAGVSGVALDPEPDDVVSLDRGLEPPPKLGVLDRLVVRGSPAVPLPLR